MKGRQQKRRRCRAGVGNGVRHAGTPLALVLTLDAHELRVAVGDDAPGAVARRTPDRYAGSGRGLGLVEIVSDRWGVDAGDRHKTVWAAWDRRPLSD